jgi:hypothetical protein
VTWVGQHIKDYVKNGLNLDSSSPIIQQYLYSCENNICPFNLLYSEDKTESIANYNWKCNNLPPDPQNKCTNVKCSGNQTCDPDTGKCIDSPKPSSVYTMQ